MQGKAVSSYQQTLNMCGAPRACISRSVLGEHALRGANLIPGWEEAQCHLGPLGGCGHRQPHPSLTRTEVSNFSPSQEG